jgi:anti-sigma factor RsiW
MNKDPFFESWRETGWRRRLTPAEEERFAEWLAEHPDAQSECAAEANLNELLNALPNVPVPSNFTARVVQAAQCQSTAPTKEKLSFPDEALAWCMRWLPKTALAAVLLAAGLTSYLHIQATRRAEWAKSLTTLAQPAMPSPEVLKDFDAIAALSSTPPADEELLKVMR